MGNNQYQVVTKFGNDFTWMRRVIGFIHNNPSVLKGCFFLACLIAGIILVVNGTTKTGEIRDWGVPGLFIAVLGALMSIRNIIDTHVYGSKSTSNRWNTTHGIK